MFTNAVKYKIEAFKSDFLPAHNRKKQVVVLAPKDKTECEMKTEHKGLGVRELGGERGVCSQLPNSKPQKGPKRPLPALSSQFQASQQGSSPGPKGFARSHPNSAMSRHHQSISPYCQTSYLPRGVVRQPALQVSWVPAREQASALQVAQFLRGLGFCRDHLEEGVIERHRVIVSTLVLKNTSWIKEQENKILPFLHQLTHQCAHPLYLTLQAACITSPGLPVEMDPWFSAPLEHLSHSHPKNSVGKLPGTMSRLGQQGWSEL